MALVFPGFMMMQMLSAGAIGGGISSAVARALGAGRCADADALVLHPVLINLGLGIATSVLFLAFGRPLYAAMGGRGDSLEAATTYSNVVFAGNALVWLMNTLASVIRGTGNMLVPALAVCLGVVLLVPLSPLLIFGWGPFPALGIADGGVAVLVMTGLMIAVLGWYILSGRCAVRLHRASLSRPMEAAWRQGITRRRRLRKTLSRCAVNAQQNSAAFKDRLKRVGCRVLPCSGCHGEGKRAFENPILRLKILSSGPQPGRVQL